jgi:hypothetical protein
MRALQAVIDLLVFALGAWLVVATLLSIVRAFVLPRGSQDPISLGWFRFVRRLFSQRLRLSRSEEAIDRVLGYYAPVAVLSLLPVWLFLVLIGFMAMFWATGIRDLEQAFTLSGSSLLTLGFANDPTWLHMVLTFVEATIGLILVALLISFLPTLYGNFARREAAVTMFDVRAGSPPSVEELVLRAHRIGKLTNGGLTPLWLSWEALFAEIEESHTSFPMLVFFRSPNARLSWLTAAGCVLDSAAFVRSTVAVARDPQADLCLRAGYLALRSIADFFGVTYNKAPAYPADPISVTRDEFDAVYDALAGEGVPLVADRDQAWLDFAGWRVNYDRVLLTLAVIISAPYAPWTADRSPTREQPAEPFARRQTHRHRRSPG